MFFECIITLHRRDFRSFIMSLFYRDYAVKNEGVHVHFMWTKITQVFVSNTNIWYIIQRCHTRKILSLLLPYEDTIITEDFGHQNPYNNYTAFLRMIIRLINLQWRFVRRKDRKLPLAICQGNFLVQWNF